MASPSAKRRRTSPNASIVVNASNTDLSQDSISRPSYMSPTKASLARFYPNLAPPSSEPTTPRSKGRLLLDQHSSLLRGGSSSASKISQQHRPVPGANAAFLNNVARAAGALLVSSQGDASGQPRELSPAGSLVSQSIDMPMMDAGGREPRASPPLEAAGIEAASAQRQNGPQTEMPKNIFPAVDSAVQAKAMIEPPQHELNNANIKPTTLGESDNKDLATLSTPTKRGAGAAEHEPRLPSTPRQLGIEPPGSKPTGCLSMSPKRSGKRRRIEGTKSSPLKPRPKDATPIQHIFEAQTASCLGRRPCLQFDPKFDPARSSDPHFELNHITPSTTPTIMASQLPKTDPLFRVHPLVSLRIAAGNEMPVTENGSNPMFRDILFTSPDGALTVEIRTFFNAGSKKVASITVLGLNSWASSELGTWLKAPIADRTLDTIARAIDRFWNMIETRALCWYTCEGQFSRLVDTTVGSVSISNEESCEMHEYTQGSDMQNDVAVKSTRKDSVEVPGPSFDDFTVAKLLQYAGQRCVRFKDSAACLETTWRIDFTPSGEVTSKVSAHASFPTSWAEGPDQDDLSRVDEVFVRLLRSGKTVYEAVRCIIEIVFPNVIV